MRTNAHDSLIVLVAQGLKVLAYGAGIVVLSRVLAQSDFGLMAMVAFVVGVGELFRDFGLSLATIQAANITTDQCANLFWVNTAVGGFLCAATICLSGAIAGFYGHASIVMLLTITSSVFLINGIAAQYRAGLTRDRRFASMALSDLVGLICATGIGVLSALFGAGALALSLQVVTQSLVSLLMVVTFGGWLPGLPNRRGSVSSFVGFSLNLLGVQLLTYAGRNLDNVVVGRSFGTTQLGYYAKAYQLYSQPQNQGIGPFTGLVVNALSRVRGDDEAYLRLLHRV